MRAASATRRILGDSRVLTGGCLLLLVLFAAAFAPWLAPHDPNEQDLLQTVLPPAWDAAGNASFPLGTDSLGRCILSRLIYGARIAVLVGTVAPVGTLLLGAAIALLAGYFGGRVDWLVSRAVDIWMSFPPIVMALILMIGLSHGLKNVILAIIVVDWTRFCRVVRGEILGLMKQDYIPAARIAGASHVRVVVSELLPGLFPILVTLFTIEIGIAIIIESVLSFVGVAMAPGIPTWGMMIADGLVTVFQQPSGLVFPMMAIIASVLGANMLGDGLRRVLDPRLVARGAAA
jgi:peptide/nickel transport system permease protein